MKLHDLLGCVGVATILLLASALVPLIGPFFSLVIPLPFLYYSTKLGVNQGVKLASITVLFAALLSALLQYPYLIFLCLEFSLLGLVLAEIYRRKLKIGLSVLLGTSFVLIIGLIILTVAGLRENMGPLEMVYAYVESSLQQSVQVYENIGASPDNAHELGEYLRMVTNVISKIYPSLLIIGTGFVVWFNIIVSRPIFQMRNLPYPPYGALDRWRSHEFMVWGLIGAGFSFFLPASSIRWLATNALIVMMAVYVFQGLSILLFFLNKYRIPPWIRFGVYFLILFQQIFMIALAVAGLFDQWIDFRRIHSRKVD
ncbi:MAG: YybS family protein [Deltaproteobacteria bacterium]|nr:YybS family protein [Deltaproteobacteria bacterium]